MYCNWVVSVQTISNLVSCFASMQHRLGWSSCAVIIVADDTILKINIYAINIVHLKQATSCANQATGYEIQHTWYLSQSRINWESCSRKGVWRKNGGNAGGVGTDSPDGLTSSGIVSAFASVIFPLLHKTQKTACITPWAPPHEWVNVSCGTELLR